MIDAANYWASPLGLEKANPSSTTAPRVGNNANYSVEQLSPGCRLFRILSFPLVRNDEKEPEKDQLSL